MILAIRPTVKRRVTFFLFADVIFSFITLYVSYLLRFNFHIPAEFLIHFLNVAFILIVLKAAAIHLWRNYSIVWRFYSLHDLANLFFAHLSAYTLFTLAYHLMPGLFSPFPRSVIVIDMVLSFVATGGIRLLKQLVLDGSSDEAGKAPAILFGISANTSNLVKSLLENHEGYSPRFIVPIRSENLHMIGLSIHNCKIISLESALVQIKELEIKTAIIDGALSNEALQTLYPRLSSAGIMHIKRSRLLGENNSTIENLSVEDLLARHPKDLDSNAVEAFIRGKKVLITGAGGSIGSEIVSQCHRYGASELILIDHSEFNLYRIGESFPNAALHLCSVTDQETLRSVFSVSRPDIVVHAAAYKHVPICEANPHSAIMNNIIGSRNLIDTAIAYNVPKIVIISTDKAVRPTNVMGTTKRVVELYAQNIDPKNSEIVSVRFGNVLGSSGSVIPKFKEQIESGGPVTITHPEVTRYFMLIDEACQLVLQAAAMAKGGELFILDMGQPVKILDLAQTMIRLYATRPIDIVATGLRPGEKLYEELLIDQSEQKTSYESITIARSTPYDIETLNRQIDALASAEDIRSLLREIVPEYTPNP